MRPLSSSTCLRVQATRSRRSTAWEGSGEEGKRHTPTPDYTSNRYPKLKRDERFAKLSQPHVDHFKSILSSEPESAVLHDNDPASSDLEAYNADWMRKYRGQATLVLRPSTTEQVSQILAYCNKEKLAIVPQGGNSGLVGGSVPVFDEIVLNLGRMAKIRSFDEVSGILVSDAGVVMEIADNYLKERGHLFPLDLGAKGSAQLGGVVSTNAGGLRLLRYGSMHGNVLGIEAVLPDGTIVDDLLALRKNNTGYDIKQLFIGGEGTIGAVTGISLLCPQRSSAVNVAAFGVDSFEKVQSAFKEAKGRLGEIMSAFEFMDAASQRCMKIAKDLSIPLEGKYPFYVLIETSGSNPDHDQEKLESFLEHVMSEEIVADGVVAQDQTQATNLWTCREGIAESLAHWGSVYKYDLSVPIPHIWSLVEATREKMIKEGLMASSSSEDKEEYPVVDVVGFGHLGDGNLHLNIPTRRFDKAVEKALEPFVYELVRDKKGSISAEHGLGLTKKDFISYSRSDTMIGLMKSIKQLYDPVSSNC